MGEGDEARRGETRGGEGEGGTQVNTRECIVCGERAGSVAILRIAPASLLFPFSFRPRSFSASAPILGPRYPPGRATPFCFSTRGVRLFSRVLLSSGAHSYVKFGTVRQRGVMYDLTGTRFCFSRSFSLFIRNVRRVGGKKNVRACAFFFLRTTFAHRGPFGIDG